MDNYLYLAMNGAAQAMLAQQSNANNLANVSTVGFKSALDFFESNPVSGPRVRFMRELLLRSAPR